MFENPSPARFDGQGQAQAIIQRVEVQGIGVFDPLEIARSVRPFADLGGVEVVERVAEVPAHAIDVAFHANAVVVALDPNRTGGWITTGQRQFGNVAPDDFHAFDRHLEQRLCVFQSKFLADRPRTFGPAR
ncbi:hypothetical protein D3C85_1384430 [compost metagenome]